MEGIGLSPPHPPGSFFTPLLISMAGIVSTSVVIVLYHLVLIKYCRRRQENNTTGRVSRRRQPVLDHGVDGHLAAGDGVDKKVLETIPIISYSAENGGVLFRVDQSECVVCLGELEEGDSVRLLPNCRHAFHVTCIDAWFFGHKNCPICRSPIVEIGISIANFPVGNGQGDIGVEVSDHGGDSGQFSGGGSASRPLLRHCVSMVLVPTEEEKPRRLVTGLKRSLSMDQSSVLVNMQRENERASSSSSSSSSSSAVLKVTRSVRQLDRVSTILTRSFSRLRIGRGSTASGILPY